MVRTLELRATQDGVIWPSRPVISARGLLSSIKNLPLTSYDKTQLTRFRDVTFNSTGELLAATDEKGRIFVFFIASNRYALVQHLGVPTIACCFSPIRKTELLVTCENETARCIDVQSQVLISTLRGHRYPARSVSFQKSGKLALTASQDAVILWDTRDWSRFRVLNAGPGVEAATFVARGDLVAVCFQDDTIMMWALESLALQYRFALPEHEQPAGLHSITVSDDHRVLVASGRSPFIYVWDFEAQTIIRIIELPAPINDVVTHAFLPGHVSTISLLERGGALYFLDVAAARPRIQLELARRDKTVTAFDIECHARYLAACSDDGYLLLYDLEIARETARRARIARRNEGLGDLDDAARLATRLGLRSTASARPASSSKRADTSRPITSRLIDSLFSAPTAPRRRERLHVDVDTELPHVSSAGRRRAHVLDSSPTHHDDHRVADSATSASAAKPRTTNPLRATTASVPLSVREVEVNRKRLAATLRCNGAYPRKYRLLVWRFLLQLPKNAEAFRALVRKGPHPAFTRLHVQYPLRDARLHRRLKRVLSAIAFWCPAFGEVPYLPEVVYPFVKLFQTNDLAAFEASVSVLLHWCSGFLRCLPRAPTHVLAALDLALQRLDPTLHAHFTKLGVGVETYAWSLLKTLFTEVLSESEWLALWDDLFTHAQTPERLSVAVLAYLAHFRIALLSACDAAAVEQFFHQQNALQLASFLQLLARLSERVDLAALRGDASVGVEATADGADSKATRSSTTSLWPLPVGQYPAFSNYPKFVVDFQIGERNRIALEESTLEHKQQQLADIEQQCAKLEAEHAAWLAERQVVLAAEETRRTEALAAEKARLQSLEVLDAQTRKRRLERLDALEKHAHDALEATASAFAAETARREAALALQRERAAAELASRQQDEALARVEFETEKRVRAVLQQRAVETRLQTLRNEFAARVQQHELADVAKLAQWRREDDARARAVETDLQRREQLAFVQHEAAARQQLEADLLAARVATERELAALETERAARQHAQRAVEEMDDEMDARRAELDVLNEHRDGAASAAVVMLDGNELQGDRGPKQDARRTGRTAQSEDRHRTQRSRSTRDRDPRTSSSSDGVDRIDGQHSENRMVSRDAGHDDKHLNAASPLGRHELTTPQPSPSLPTGASQQQAMQHATLASEPRAALERSLLHASSSDSSFTSAVLERTMEEMTLLERALRTISSSSSSNSSSKSSSRRTRGVVRDDRDSRQPQTTGRVTSHTPSRLQPQSTQRERQYSSVSFADNVGQYDNNIDNDVSTQRGSERVVAVARDGTLEPQASRMRPVRCDSDKERNDARSSDSVSSDENRSDTSRASAATGAVQRPIAELERELGIRFDDFSDDEHKEEDSAFEDVGSDDDDDSDYGDDNDDSDYGDDDGAIEDDRARLLARAKKLLEAEEFSSDDDDEP